ncbi:hypothetical protein BDV95DRAFT_586453 [Massariosphaeria phaeospora]|uniref:Uncharacterized protein n=1 Tax=Massariosphaeria phaeospora TaxID=100035 RepID=A0A7C8M1X4_9PLEO|nr:hypothetical protein BDV95DRAFT_586453 [Massariosphaeria phaeospora]
MDESTTRRPCPMRLMSNESFAALPDYSDIEGDSEADAQSVTALPAYYAYASGEDLDSFAVWVDRPANEDDGTEAPMERTLTTPTQSRRVNTPTLRAMPSAFPASLASLHSVYSAAGREHEYDEWIPVNVMPGSWNESE